MQTKQYLEMYSSQRPPQRRPQRNDVSPSPQKLGMDLRRLEMKTRPGISETENRKTIRKGGIYETDNWLLRQ